MYLVHTDATCREVPSPDLLSMTYQTGRRETFYLSEMCKNPQVRAGLPRDDRPGRGVYPG